MDCDEAHINNIIRALNSNIEDEIIDGLNELKKTSLETLLSSHVFRNDDFIKSLMELVSSSNPHIQNLALISACSYSSHQDFIVKVHNYGLLTYISVLKVTKYKLIQEKIMHILCRQLTYDPSKIILYENNLSTIIISTLKSCETDGAKYYGIKILRMLSTSKEKMNRILGEKGLYIACSVGLSETSNNLLQLTMQYVMSFIKRRCIGTLYFAQVIAGADNLQTFKKIYEQDNKCKHDIFELFLLIFSHHFSCTNHQEYSKNIEVLDLLCMANLPLMIVNELTNSVLQIDRRKIILVLCKICKLGSQWRKYSCNVLPTYHDRTWMQISTENRIPIFISLLSAHQNDKELLQALLRAILGLEHLHSNKFQVLQKFIEASVLLLLTQIFDKALKIACSCPSKVSKPFECTHYNHPKITKKKTDITAKLIPPDMLEFVAKPYNDSHIRPIDKFMLKSNRNCITEREIVGNEGTSLTFLDNTKVGSSIELTAGVSPLNLSTSNPHISVMYKEINKIKFRTGNKSKSRRERSLTVSENCKIVEKTQTKLRRTLSSCPAVPENWKSCPKITPKRMLEQKSLDETTLYWMKILEYLVRFIYQVFVYKEDIKNICKEFLPKVYAYISKACIVHESANLILEVLAKNTSCIQYVLDVLFIPMLVVDLRDVTATVDCPQCIRISQGIDMFLNKLGFFFSHFHQYGRCEIANRLNPSKDANVKNSSLVAVTHVVKCPLQLYNFLIEHRGLDQLINIFCASNAEEPMHLYGIASVCRLITNLKLAYKRKYLNNCIFCDSNITHLPNCVTEGSKSKRTQLLLLTGATYHNLISLHSVCKVKDESNINCSFKLENGKIISANRELLSTRNDVLKTMLLGSFSESLENCVEIKDITSQVMEMVIHFAYGCTCDIFLCKDANTYAELLFVAQMYFIPELQIFAMHYLCEFLCSEEIYSFLDEYLNLMTNDLLQHFFCSLLSQPGSVSNKAKWVDYLLSGKERDKFISNIQPGISNIMQQVSSLCNCDVFYEPIR